MTHEELLKDIDDQEFAYDNLASALRAVVELHSPVEEPEGLDCGYCASAYPCPTIEAIEKELG